MTDREVMQMALDDFIDLKVEDGIDCVATILALRTALAQPEPEPVAWMYDWTTSDGEFIQDWTTSEAETLRDTEPNIISNIRPLYRSLKREWVGLTDEEIDKYSPTDIVTHRVAFARVLEAKLKEKNT